MFPARPELSHLIDYYWLLTIAAPEMELEIIPDTAIDLVLCHEIAHFAALYFPTTEIQRIRLQGPVNYAGICFRPAAINLLFESELADLRKLDTGLNTIESLDIGTLVAGIQETTDIRKLKSEFDQFWVDRMETVGDSESTLCHSELIKLLEGSLGNESVASVCRSLQISERHFRRLSTEMFGLSPKKIQRILRLQVVLTELFECERQQIQDLYYDDSHRIRELKNLTGFTPQQIRKMAEKYNQS